MRIDEILFRERFADAICATVEAQWSEQYAQPVHVRQLAIASGQRWVLHRLFSAFFVPSLDRRGRRFLADSFRYTRVRGRRGPQWMVGTALATGPLLRAASKAAFFVDPPIPNPSSIVLVPGNRRLRSFDLAACTTRAMLKTGFPTDAIANEVRVRGGTTPGPLVPLASWGDGWLEEPLLEGRPLTRCPNSSTPAIEAKAVAGLARWLEANAEPVEASDRVEALLASIRPALEACRARYSVTADVSGPLATLAATAARLGPIEQSIVHGDFQAGNVFAMPDAVVLLDWEYATIRVVAYDAVVYLLELHGRGSGWQRLDDVLRRPDAAPVGQLLRRWPDEEWRRRMLAMVALEELDHHAADALGGPLLRPPVGFTALVEALPRLASVLGET